MNLVDDKFRILKEQFGFSRFRPGQEDVIDAVLAGRHVMAVMPTGSGKSLCFQVPALLRDGLTIVVSPLVALMQDQVTALNLAGIAAASINSGFDRDINVATWRRVAAGEIRLLYLSPERLMTERMLDALSRLPVHLIAIDEAHCVSQWGPAFRPEYADLARLQHIFPDIQIMALTATADEITRRDMEEKLFAGNCSSFVTGFDRPNIHLAVEAKSNWKQQLLAMVDAHRGESGIVYCLSRKKTEEVTVLLNGEGYSALTYHAGMEKTDRSVNQDRFLTEPGLIMVATVAFGMGIDKADIRFVFHTDLPASPEAYYQEIGRAGRDGGPAEARTLYGLADLRMRRVFIDQEESSDDRRRREHQRLDRLVGFCEAPSCRRVVLLDYFGEPSEPCGNCDICQNPVELTDGTSEALDVISAIEQSGEMFGIAQIIDILRGAETAKIAKFNHHELPIYGSGAERPKNQWQSILRQMVAAGLIEIDIANYGGLRLTDAGRALDSNGNTFAYRADIAAPRTKKSRRAAKSAIELAPHDQGLLDALKLLRLELARERNVPAYVIFSDRSLDDMVVRRPANDVEFLDVHGVGESKLRKFAQPFLQAIAQHGDG